MINKSFGSILNLLSNVSLIYEHYSYYSEKYYNIILTDRGKLFSSSDLLGFVK